MKNEFTELDLNKSIEEMSEQEAKTTLSDFMEAHQKNQTAYDAVQEELRETETEYEEKLEQREEKIAEFRDQRAEEAAEYVKMPADLLADKFSIEEIEQIISEAEESDEFSEEEQEAGDDEDDETRYTTFAERDEKGERESGSSVDRERVKGKLEQHW